MNESMKTKFKIRKATKSISAERVEIQSQKCQTKSFECIGKETKLLEFECVCEGANGKKTRRRRLKQNEGAMGVKMVRTSFGEEQNLQYQRMDTHTSTLEEIKRYRIAIVRKKWLTVE